MDEGKLLELFRRVVREELKGSVGEVDFGEAARRLSISPSTVRRMVKTGELVSVTISKSPRVPVSELVRLATPKPSMPTIGRPPLGHQAMAKLRAGRLKRKNSTLADELAELKAGRKKR